MFNSHLIEHYSEQLKNAVWERQKEITDWIYDLWTDTDDREHFLQFYFPPGFVDRDPERAKMVMNNLRNIVHSYTVRHDPEPIYCYVMYQMIEAWFEDEEYLKTLELVPDEVKAFIDELKSKEEAEAQAYIDEHKSTEEAGVEDQTESEFIYAWFTDKDTCLGDFEDTYDMDYIDESIPEEVAEMYLKYGKVPDSFGADVHELLDLLPGDLFDRVTVKT